MSADLFAAFMAEDSASQQKGNRNINNSSSTRAIQQNATSLPFSLVKQVKQHTEEQSGQQLRSEDVLFDAETEDADDEFGSFETVTTPPRDDIADAASSAQPSKPVDMQALSDNLLDLNLSDERGPSRSNHAAVQFSPPNMFGDTKIFDKVSKDMTRDWDDGWGDFEQISNHDAIPSKSPELAVRASSVRQLNNGGDSIGIETKDSKPTSTSEAIMKDNPHYTSDDDDWEPFEASAITTAAPDLPKPLPHIPNPASARSHSQATNHDRPTNIPPPSSLLQLLPTVFAVLKNASTADQILSVHATAIRLTAGRTFRWKRDTILSQSMRIGQAGKQGGMKLASVNKSESTKEDMDVRDLLISWSDYVHSFNQAVARNGKPATRLKLSASPTTKTIRAGNTIGVNKQCALCGLNRHERIEGLDVDVDDLFGEFWVEHWGHKQCYDFWYDFKDMLDQR
jgi:hypothetical protein